MLLTILNTAISLTTLVVLLWVVHQYIKARREIGKLSTLLHTKNFEKKMDDLLDGLLANEAGLQAPAASAPAVPQTTAVAEQREKLAIIAAGGQAGKYLGKSLSVEEIDNMDDDEVRKLHTRYEARLGVCMTKTLGKAALQLYTTLATMFLPLPPENQQPLMEDLESDMIVDRVLNRTACELHYRYGNFLAPITVALTTAKYCQFGHRCPKNTEEDELEIQQCVSAGGDNHSGGDNHTGGYIQAGGDNHPGGDNQAGGENQASGATTCFKGDGPQPAV